MKPVQISIRILLSFWGILLFIGCSSVDAPAASTGDESVEDLVEFNDPDVVESIPEPTPKPRVSCPVDEAERYLTDLEDALVAFEDTLSVAGSTSRINLSQVILEMQSQRRDVADLDPPGCGSYLNDLAIVYMNAEIDSFIAFMGQEDDAIVAAAIKWAAELKQGLDDEILVFGQDPEEAYYAFVGVGNDVELAATLFERPDGWVDVPIENLVFSVPPSWTIRDDDDVLFFEAGDAYGFIITASGDNRITAELSTDRVVLSVLRETLIEVFEGYQELAATTTMAAENRVRSITHTTEDEDILRKTAVIVMPRSTLEVMVSTTLDANSSPTAEELAVLDMVYASFRRP